ncbi:Transport protein particle (TRAPP) component [Carpediemonas membranifera]|uniref:Transport protein particle (TRAPP) component n=1 Tax=Carpediemonas membranifera TaxID=201153 RepID=A0A8J6B3T4_9EUKA|nr:Transport protein particle (TRAPP) component [Carpediemonas membranifera]|eukprot:KAG9395118.1 Transport protein particle (TRAPP) component [Carpediemonas membranifera]
MAPTPLAATSTIVLHNEMLQYTLEKYPDSAIERVEQMGFSIGLRLVERLALASTRPLLGKANDVVMFICKDFWTAAFGRQATNLRQQRGVFYITDNAFPWIINVSRGGPKDAAESTLRSLILSFASAVIGGALSSLGAVGSVVPNAHGDQVEFTVTGQFMA